MPMPISRFPQCTIHLFGRSCGQASRACCDGHGWAGQLAPKRAPRKPSQGTMPVNHGQRARLTLRPSQHPWHPDFVVAKAASRVAHGLGNRDPPPCRTDPLPCCGRPPPPRPGCPSAHRAAAAQSRTPRARARPGRATEDPRRLRAGHLHRRFRPQVQQQARPSRPSLYRLSAPGPPGLRRGRLRHPARPGRCEPEPEKARPRAV